MREGRLSAAERFSLNLIDPGIAGLQVESKQRVAASRSMKAYHSRPNFTATVWPCRKVWISIGTLRSRSVYQGRQS
jgi:hypothetical protein